MSLREKQLKNLENEEKNLPREFSGKRESLRKCGTCKKFKPKEYRSGLKVFSGVCELYYGTIEKIAVESDWPACSSYEIGEKNETSSGD